MDNKNLSQNHRAGRLCHIRSYLEWLEEHGKLKNRSENLVKSSDFPRQVKTLPRPFSVNIDLEIQKRLQQVGDIDHLGLLLMRRCGLE